METTLSRAQLRWQAAKGLVGLLAVLGLLIFVAAGTLDYWQGWIYWGLFTLATTLVTVYFLTADPKLVERRLRAGPAGEKEMRQKIVQAVASVFFLSTIVVPALDRRFGWSYVPSAISVAAAALFVFGFVVMFLVFRENSYAASTIEVAEGQGVITTGPYRVVRHPMYAGGLVSFLATPIALGSWWGIIPALGLIFAIVARLRDEERFLVENLPGYDAYRAGTPARLIPWLW